MRIKCVIAVLAALVPGLPAAQAYPLVGGVNAEGYAFPFFSQLSPELDGLRVAARGTAWGYVDTSGKWVIGPQFTGGALPFVNGRAIVWDAGGANARLIDRGGARVGDAPDFIRTLEYAFPTEDPRLFTFRSKSAAGGNDSYGVVSAEGVPVVQIVPTGNEGIYFHVANGQILTLAGTGNSHYDVVRVHDLAGKLLLDKRMPAGTKMYLRSLGEYQYYSEFAFHRDRAFRRDKAADRVGYIDLQGSWAIPPQFVEARAFHDAVAVAVTKADYRKDQQSAVLIDTQGRKVASLPTVRCVAAAENGLIYALLPAKGNGDPRGALLDYKGKQVAELPALGCMERTPWLDDSTLLIGSAVVRRDGTLLQGGKGPVSFSEYQRVERDRGIAIVQADSASVGEDLGAMRAQRQSKDSAEQGFLSDVLLRPMDIRYADRTLEPAFNRYWAMRIYKQGDYLYEMIIEVRAREGRPVQDGDKIAAVAGCRPPAGWLLVRKGLVFPADRKDPLKKMGKQFDAFRKEAFGGASLVVNSGIGHCQFGYVVDGPIP